MSKLMCISKTNKNKREREREREREYNLNPYMCVIVNFFNCTAPVID